MKGKKNIGITKIKALKKNFEKWQIAHLLLSLTASDPQVRSSKAEDPMTAKALSP